MEDLKELITVTFLNRENVVLYSKEAYFRDLAHANQYAMESLLNPFDKDVVKYKVVKS